MDIGFLGELVRFIRLTNTMHYTHPDFFNSMYSTLSHFFSEVALGMLTMVCQVLIIALSLAVLAMAIAERRAVKEPQESATSF